MPPTWTNLLSPQNVIVSQPIAERGAQHKYTCLTHRDSIRLLVLHSAAELDAPLQISFLNGSLDSVEGDYEAISYTWGHPQLSFPLYVDDGTCVFVTENLDSALRALRYVHRPRTLWADAVCIDQANDAEKAVQIPLMAQIFRGASRVLAWLGRSASRERGISALQRWSRHRIKYAQHIQAQSLMDLDVFEMNSAIPHHHRPGLFETAMESVIELLQSSWFTRLWIIQEVVFNLDVVLIDGASEMSWTRFISTLHLLRDYRQRQLDTQVSDSEAAIQLVADLWKYNSGFEGSEAGDKQLGIMRLLRTFENHGCADGRDRIFALYSMANDIVPAQGMPSPTKISMDIDYTIDIAGVYKTFASACLIRDRRSASQETPNLDPDLAIPDEHSDTIFSARLARQFHPMHATWPSWVPDWRAEPRIHQEMIGNLQLGDCRVINGDRAHIFTTFRWWDPARDPKERIDELLGVREVRNSKISWEVFPVISVKFRTIDHSFSTVQELYDKVRQSYTSDVAYSKEFLCQIVSEIWPTPGRIDPVKDLFHRSGPSPSDPFKEYIEKALSHACFFVADIDGAKFIGFGNYFLASGDILFPFHTHTPPNTYSDGSSHAPRKHSWKVQELHQALIVRRCKLTEGSKSGGTCRLIGTACLVGPIWEERFRGVDRNGRKGDFDFVLS